MAHSPKLIGAVERALDILDLFNERTPELGITEIAAATGLHKSTAAGLIYTLTAKGYLRQDAASRRYRLGLKLIERAEATLSSLSLRQVAMPFLHQLRDAFDETVNLAVLDNGRMVYVERLLCSKVLGARSKIGKHEPVHSTALGKAMLAYLPISEVRAYSEQHGLRSITTRTITDLNLLLTHLEQVRRQGYAVDDEENEEGVRCVAAAIFDHTSRPVASVSVSAPTIRLPLENVPWIGAKVREIALAISGNLGYVERAEEVSQGKAMLQGVPFPT